MKVLITGGAGYIGSVLTARLLYTGLTVTVFDTLHYGGEGVLAYRYHPRFKLIEGDIQDPGAVKAAMKDVDVVIHLAAFVGDRACEANQDNAFTVNVDGTATVLAEAKRSGASKFLFASTASCYGANADGELATEKSSLQPLTQYALTKIAAEVLVRAENSDKFQTTVLRFATVFGLSPRMRFDLIINQFVQQAVCQSNLSVYSPEAWRSHIHVYDLARMLRMLAVAKQDIGGQTFNVGGFNRRKADLVAEIEKLTDVRVQYVDAGEDKRDYQVSFKKLGLPVPEITPEQGIQEMVDALQSGVFWSPHSDRHVNT